MYVCQCPAVLKGNEREELDSGLGVVGLEKDEGGDDEGREYGGKQTGLLNVSFVDVFQRIYTHKD